jgi:hypothetical protein
MLEELSSKLGKNYVFESQVSLRENMEAVNATPQQSLGKLPEH